MLEVITEWSGPQGSGLLNIMHFAGEDPALVGPAREAISVLMGGYDGVVSNQYSWSVRTSGRILRPSDGQILGVWTDGTPYGAPGGQNQQPVADATQVLAQWQTGQVLRRRLVRGRTFLPGLANGSTANGNITSGVLASLNGVLDDFLEQDTTFVIWSRPVPAAGEGPARPGVATPVVAGTVWPELAVQRRRRN